MKRITSSLLALLLALSMLIGMVPAAYAVDAADTPETRVPDAIEVQSTEEVEPLSEGSAIVARIGTSEYTDLVTAMNELTAENHTLELVDQTAWPENNPVYWAAGEKSGYVATLTDALTAAYKANAANIKIVCRPGADVGTMTHGHVADDITIYGNNAYISGGECELEVDTYKFSRQTGKQDTTNGESLTKDITITAYELDNLGVWGQRTTDKTVTVNLTDCDGKAIEGKTNVQRVYISGTIGVNNITLTGCDFMTNNTSVYSNADGAISINNCSFTGSTVPVNFNHKAGGSQTLNVEGCSFTSCGDNGEWKQFAAPVRFVNSGSGTQSATVDACTFAYTVGSNGDILLGDGRTGQESNDVTLTVTNTTATVQAQKPGYYDGTATDTSKGAKTTVESSETLNTSVEEMLPTALTAYVTVNGGTEQYATLDEAIAAAEPENGVIIYTVTGKVNANGESWIQVAKAGLTGLTEVKFVGADANAEICITNSNAVLADQSYDIDVSFKDLTLSHPNGAWVSDLGHATNYFTTVLRNTDAANNTVSYTNCTFPNGACNNQYGKTVYANCKFTNATSGKYNLWNYGGNTEIKNSTFTGTRGIKAYSEGTDGGDISISGTTFDDLNEKAAIVASKPVGIVLDNVAVTGDSSKGLFTRDISGNDELTISATGTGISGTFDITSDATGANAKGELNISAGTFNSEVSSDYCADGFEVKANENGTYGVVESTQTTKGTRENPYTLDDLSTMTRAEYIAAQERLGGTMYVTVGDYSYETNGTLGNGTADNSDRDSTKMNYYGAPGAKEGQYSDAAVGKNIVFVGGNITSGVTGYKDVDNPGTSLLLAVPAYTNVTFEGTTFKNVMSFNYQLYTSPWSQLGELKFDGCTFNGIIVGAIAAQTLTFNNCNFGNYTNTYAENGKNVGANNSNPIWVRPAYGNWTKGDNEGQGSDFKSLTTINFTGNTVVSTRPVKFERIAQWEMDTTVTATGNTFTISKQEGDTSTKNVGLYFGANAKFDLIADNNKAEGSTAALYTAVYTAPNGTSYAGLPAGSTVKDSTGKDVPLEALEWKSDKKLTLATSTEVAELSTMDSKNNPVTVRFATLAAAIAAAKDGDTVTLLSNIELTSAQKISKKLTLDLNGKTLDSTAYRTIQLNSGANLTVQDSVETGKIANSYNGSSYPSTVYLNAKDTVFTLVSGTIESDPYKTSLQSVAINSLKDKACTVNIQGGSVVVPAAAKEGRAIVASTNSMTLNISDGKIAGGLHGIDAYSGSTVNITGGKVTATYVDTGVIKEAYGMRIIGTANVTINGGEIQGIKMDDDGYNLNVPNVTLVSGKVNGSFYSISTGTIVFTVEPTATITFEKDTVKNFLPSTVELVQNTDGTYGVKKGSYVAEINGKQYASLSDAIAAAKDGAEIRLLSDVTENGMDIEKSFTLDFNTHTLTVEDPMVGSTGTKTNAIRFLKNGDTTNTVVLKNGSIKSSKARILIQNYANLTVDNMVLDLSEQPLYGYVLSNNNGVTVINNSKISAPTAAGSLAFDACAFSTYGDVSVTLRGNSVINGDVGFSRDGNGTQNASLTLESGKINGNLVDVGKGETVTVTKSNDVTLDAPTGYKWVDGTLTKITYVAEVNGTTFETLVDAIAAAKDNDTVTLLADTTEDVVISKNITLDLNGFTLTNTEGEHTIVNNGTLTIKDSSTAQTGTVDNVTHGRGALVNNGTVILSGGTFERSAEKGKFEPYGNGGNSWYTIANYGTMTIDNGTTVKNAGGYSSNIRNGGQDSIAKLTINSGTFDGGVNTVKNDANGVLEIKGGELKNTAQYVIMNWNQATISGGTFETAETAGAVLFSSAYGTDGTACGELTITGGTFTAAGSKLIDDAYDANNHGTVKISGGSFNRAVDPKHCDTGFIPTQNEDGTYGVKEGVYVAKVDNVKYETLQAAINAAKGGSTVRLLANVTLTETAVFPAGKTVHLNLVGHNITAAGTALRINGKTDIQSTDGVGTIESTGNVAVAVGDNANLTVYSGTLKGREGAVITGTSTGAKIEIRKNPTLIATDNAVIAGNGSKRDGKPNTILVKGGTFIGGIVTDGYIACGIYAPWNDNVTVSGGTFNITNGAGIVARAGTVKVTGGTFNCGDGTAKGWVGDSKNKVPNAALVFDEAANYPALTESSQILVSGGTFSTDPAANGAKLADGYVANKDESGMYKVGKAEPVAEINGVKYDTLQAAINAAQATQGGATITLLKNINTESYYTVNGDNPVTIDLAGCNITGSGISGLFYVTAKGDLTIKGEGTVTAVEDTGAAMAVWVRSPIAKVTLEGGTYTQQITNTADPHFDLIYVERGNVYVKGGTYKGFTPDWTLNCKDEHYLSKEANIEVTGGTFYGFDPGANPEGEGTTYVKTGYVSTKNADGTYGVKEGTYVAAIGEKKYATLAEAVDAAKNGDTITLIADVEQNTMLVIKKDITLDLAGKKIFNTTDIWSDANGSYELLSIEAKVTITGNGTIDAKENDCYTINVKNGDLTIENGTFYGNVSVVQVEAGMLTINGGKFDLHQKWEGKNTYLINCIDDAFVAKTAKVAIYGGDFVDFDPNVSPEKKIDGKAPSFAAPGVGITKNENNTFTAQADMAAQIVDADGNSVKAYATLKEAVNAAKSGETVIVLKEATVEEMITAEANITIDLNQKTVTVADGAGTMLKTTGDVTIKNGTLTSAVTANIINAYGKLKLESVKIYGSTVDGSNLVNVLGNAEVTIDAASEIEADGVGVAVFVGAKSADKDAKYTLNIYGKVIQKGKSYAISGNGSYPGTSYINIYEGAEVKASNIAENNDCCAIYQPQAGEINVYGGLVEGYCAIVMKSGTLNISGGTVRGIRNDNVLGDNNSAGNGASYDGSAIVVDSRKTGYAGNVKINVTGGTVESYYSTAIREIGNDSSMTQLVELTVTGGEILGASKNLTNAENDILVRDISVSNVAISGGTFNHEVQADYCAVGYEPSEKDASGMYTVQKVSGNAYYTDDDGNLHYGYLTTLLNNEATVGRVITLIDSVDYKGSLVVEGNRTINLAGYTFESEFYVFVTNGCGIKDSTDGSALIKVAPEKLVFMSNNEQLPIYDSANKGYRLFNCKVKGKCETNGDSATIWVLPEFENKAAYKLLKSGNAHNATISVTISWTGNDGPAAQEFTFKQSLIDIYAAGEGGATFTLRLTGLGTALSGEMSNIKAQSSIKSGAGVSFTGKEYSLSN